MSRTHYLTELKSARQHLVAIGGAVRALSMRRPVMFRSRIQIVPQEVANWRLI